MPTVSAVRCVRGDIPVMGHQWTENRPGRSVCTATKNMKGGFRFSDQKHEGAKLDQALTGGTSQSFFSHLGPTPHRVSRGLSARAGKFPRNPTFLGGV
jgi:hypothetical protein